LLVGQFLRRAHLFARSLACAAKSRLLTGSPFTISHRITGRCNARCRTCLWRGNFEEELGTETIIKAYERARNAGFISTTFWGGEPLIRSDMPEIARAVRKLGITVGLITNGFFLPEKAEELAGGLDYLIVSLDLPGPEHDRLRGVDGIFGRALEGIQSVRRLDPEVKIFINSVVSTLSYPGVLAMADFARRNSLWVTFESTNTGAALDGSREVHLRLPPEKEREAFGRILAMKERGLPVNNSLTYLRMFATGRTRYACHNPKVALGVAPDGSITACLDRRTRLGNFYKGDIAEVLKNPVLGRLQKQAEQCSLCVDSGTIETSLFWEFRREVVMSTMRLFMR
jgi:MoaA/NifB/PqqE/SkfB family radical SAM enzyme